MKKTITINLGGTQLDCEGDYSPPEPCVMYYKDGSGYPGSGAEFEIETVYHGTQDVSDMIEGLETIYPNIWSDLTDKCLEVENEIL